MPVFKVITYSVTIATTMLFAFWERRVKEELTDNAVEPLKLASDIGLCGDLSDQVKRERYLRDLPPSIKLKYRVIVASKFLFALLLVGEVFVFQR